MTSSSANIPPVDSLLMVEGQDDKHVIWHLCGHEGVAFTASRSGSDMWVTLAGPKVTFQISERGSRSDLLKDIREFATTSQYGSIGVIIDADDSVNRCWGQLKEAFTRTTVVLPENPSANGVIVPELTGQPRIGVWVMPDNASPGELEDFVLQMMPDDDAIWPSSQSYINNISTPDRKFSPEKTDKAKLYAWLATRREPSRMGAAINANDLETNGPLCRSFLEWLTKLFS